MKQMSSKSVLYYNMYFFSINNIKKCHLVLVKSIDKFERKYAQVHTLFEKLFTLKLQSIINNNIKQYILWAKY